MPRGLMIGLMLCLLGGLTALAQNAPREDRTLRPQQAPTVEKSTDRAKVALVIGNSDYGSASLKNPVSDAAGIQESLESFGFKVTSLHNANRKDMEQAIRNFGDQLSEGCVGLFYFAGHGIQVKGINYLVPTGAELEREDEIPYQAIEVGQILDKMEQAKSGLNIMILDACRNNPFARSWRSMDKGLAQVSAPTGSLIAYATSPGKTAADGVGEHGLYTEALLDEMRVPGRSLLEVFQQVRKRVKEQSKGAQVPWESNSTLGDFQFRPGAPVTGASSDPAAIETAFWSSIQASRVARDFELYLAKYPTGNYAELARERMLRFRQDLPPTAMTTKSIGLDFTLKGPCEDCGLQELISELLQEKGWVLDPKATTRAAVRIQTETSLVGSEDPIMAKWQVLRAVVDLRILPGSGKPPTVKTAFEVKGVGATPLKSTQAFKADLKSKVLKELK